MRQTLKAGGQLLYHERAREGVVGNLNDWLRYDVFNRPDTIKVFEEELR